MKAVWRKPRAGKEPVSWNTGQRLGLGCLRSVHADPQRLCVYLSYTRYSDVSYPQSACLSFSFSQDCKILKHDVGVTCVFQLKIFVFVSCLATLSISYLVPRCNELLPFLHRWPISPNMAC